VSRNGKFVLSLHLRERAIDKHPMPVTKLLSSDTRNTAALAKTIIEPALLLFVRSNLFHGLIKFNSTFSSSFPTFLLAASHSPWMHSPTCRVHKTSRNSMF
jgi:hypothetical protein